MVKVSRSVTLDLFGEGQNPPPNDGKKMDQIWKEIRLQQDFDGTLNTFHPLPPPPIDLENLHLWRYQIVTSARVLDITEANKGS